MIDGVIVKGISGIYSVVDKSGRVYECKARGKFRMEKLTPMVGDRVAVEIFEDGSSIINEIYPRKNQMLRPYVANIDQAILVFSIKKPDINFTLLDKLLILIEHNGIDAKICLNKSDLADDEEIDRIKSIYEKVGYELIKTNGKTGEGLEDVKKVMKDKISVFTGPSGVGKSTIFNKIQDKVIMETGDISIKIERGKHTTRHAELIEVSQDTFVVDTPGFSSLDLSFIEANELQYSFREFAPYIGMCKFTSCIHGKESGCKIKEKLEEGVIMKERYDTYLKILQELKEIRRKW